MSKTDVIFVNQDKYRRAVDLVDLINGKRSPVNNREADVFSFWQDQIKAEDLTKASDDAKVRFVYEKLGGLVRTHVEEAKAKAKKAEIQKKKGKGGKKGK